MKRLLACVLIVAATLVASTLPAAAASTTLGDGAWSWFQGPRAITTTQGETLASSVGDAGVNILSTSLQSSAGNPTPRTTVTVDRALFHDDHDAAGLLELANGEILAAWSGHAQDKLIRVAVRSTAKKWTRLGGFATQAVQTYNNLYQLSNGSVLDFTRRGQQPWLYRSLNNGRTWKSVGRVLSFGSDRPYVKYAQHGDRIYFATTEGHPSALASRGIDSAIWAGYVEGTTIFRSDGTAAGTVGPRAGVDVTTLTKVYTPAVRHAAWTADIVVGADGNPVVAWSVRDRNVPWNGSTAIRYSTAGWSGTAWIVRDLAPGGRSIFVAESDYNGGVALDPTNPDHVVISSTLDPTTNASNARFSLYEGHSSPVGETWQRVSNTGQNALRPTFTIRGGVLLWFAGTYSSYRTFKTSVNRLS